VIRLVLLWLGRILEFGRNDDCAVNQNGFDNFQGKAIAARVSIRCDRFKQTQMNFGVGSE
jgi:hypothetical protein